MHRIIPIVLSGLTVCAALRAECVSFLAPPAGSQCALSSSGFEWLNPPAERRAGTRLGRPVYDPAIGDPALLAGILLSGEQRFELQLPAGPHLVEVFVSNPEADRFAFRLLLDGRAEDERPLIAPGPGRLRPKGGPRHVTLFARASGKLQLALRTGALSYTLYAVRWTPMERLERELVPKWRERARFVHSNIVTASSGQNPTVRRAWLQQLGDRLAFSAQEEIRKEGLLHRARAWFWLAAENHEPDDLLQTERLLVEGLRVMPADPIVRQMISAACTGQVVRVGRMPEGDYCNAVQPVPWNVELPAAPPAAPEWALAQRELARRMEALTRWWVEKRQAPNGELGGGWGDDVEILRHWGPQALGLGSEIAARGVRNVAAGLWNSGTLRDGYDRGVSDVEHSSEPTTDTLPLAAALNPGDAEFRNRLGVTAACSEHWIRPQPDGFLRFRSSWFNCREADTSPARAVDVHLNTRAMGPALWHAYLTRDPALIRRIAGWTDSWIRAMRQTEHGKPAGVFPPVLRAFDGSYLVGSDRWDQPEAEWDYFQWRGGSQEAIASLVLAVYDLTGDRRYLEAAGESFRPMTGCAAHPEICKEMASAPEAFFVWRQATGDSRYDAAFGYRAEAPEEETLRRMARLARESGERFSVNWDMLTSEVLYTDRVYYSLHPEYRWRLFGGEAPRGDRYPTFAVTWPPSPAEVARAVLSAGEDRLRIRAYSFEDVRREIPVRLWRLKPGRYTWRAGLETGAFTVSRLPHDLTIPLPPKTDATIEIRGSAKVTP
ncbi:MAG: hypothetical protein HY822_01605 [Acidobacteria bacterium]|nr:hypothetical protein [Acidobacteriota bacterium]